jgi:putative ABC transport system permease protein
MRALVFAARSLVRQPGRAAVGILGIAAVGALLFDMLLLSRGLVVSFRTLLDSEGFDIRVMATEPAPVPGPRLTHASEIVSALAALPEVDEAVPIRLVDAEAAARGHAILFSLTAIDARARRPWTLAAGSDLVAAAPGEPPPMLLNRRLAAALGVSPGDQVAVRVTCSVDRAAPLPVRFLIRGLADFPFDDPGQMTAAAGIEAVAGACGDDAGSEADMVLVASREGFGPDKAVQAIRRLRPDLHPATNEEIVARMQQLGFTYFRQISTVLSTITMLFGFLLITVLLTVSVNQRLGDIAALRALGFSRRRVVADVLWQSVLLVGLGGLLALPLGLALSTWLDWILKAMPGIPEAMHFFVFEPRALLLQAGLLGLTAVLAALYPMQLVARLPIAETLRNEVVS